MKFLCRSLLFGLLPILFIACQSSIPVVHAALETAPVSSTEDAADDMAIFIHPSDITKNAIIGTDKQKGLVVYDTKGAILHDYAFGRINNVDIRQGVVWNDQEITIIGGSNRTNNTIVFYALDAETLELTSLEDSPILSRANPVYGFCLYLPSPEELYAFVVGKDGLLEQWRIQAAPNSKVRATLERSIQMGGQCEGLVADDLLQFLYIGEEEKGIWKIPAQPDQEAQPIKVAFIAENKNLKADIEGLTIYYEGKEGYLIASSQGNHSYAIYKRSGSNTYLGSFRIKTKDEIDGTFDTDGIDVNPAAFSSQFPNGIFIAQDGKNKGGNQNFKIVDWDAILENVGLKN